MLRRGVKEFRLLTFQSLVDSPYDSEKNTEVCFRFLELFLVKFGIQVRNGEFSLLVMLRQCFVHFPELEDLLGGKATGLPEWQAVGRTKQRSQSRAFHRPFLNLI